MVKAVKTNVLFIIMSSLLGDLFAEPLQVGEAAPAVKVTNDLGEITDMGALYKSGPVLVYFYPKSDTPGCTKQACNLRDHFVDLEQAGITVMGVSSDKVEAQARFKEKYALPFTIIADTEHKLGKGFRVGKLGSFYSRQSFLVVDGKVAWRDLKATPAKQAEDILTALKQLPQN